MWSATPAQQVGTRISGDAASPQGKVCAAAIQLGGRGMAVGRITTEVPSAEVVQASEPS
jgi:hypothetical protein